jgi:outer membrane biosynthesis protein TonB
MAISYIQIFLIFTHQAILKPINKKVMTRRYPNATAGIFLYSLLLTLAFAKYGQAYAQEFFPATPFGGKQQLKDFFDEHLVYPRNELSSGIEGSVALAFDIDAKGIISQLKVLQTGTPGMTKEAIRLFNLLLWDPANYRGKFVSDHQQLTIPFNIKHYRRICRLRGYDTITFPFHPADTSFKTYTYRHTDKVPVPVFNDKDDSFQSFMRRNFHYPDLAFKQNITGIVNVNFIVEPYGIISNVYVDNHLGAGCSEEAMRLVKLISWMPGIIEGKAVRVRMKMSITFSLDGKNKFEYQPNQASNSMN